MSNKQPEGLKPGIYFGLPFERYLDDPALSHTGIMQLAEDRQVYWLASAMNPHRKEEKTDAMEKGTQAHLYILEEDKFFEEYMIQPGAWEDGKKIIRNSEFDDIKMMKGSVQSDEFARHIIQGGYPEVSIIWEHPIYKIRIKTRHDYFKPKYTTDYKTIFTLENSKLSWRICDKGYDVQSCLYIQARQGIREAIQEGKAGIYGDVSDKFIHDFIDSDEDLFVFLFQRTEYPFPVRCIHLDYDIHANAAGKIIVGIEEYKDCIEKYGSEKIWPSKRKGLEEFSITQMPKRIYD